MARPGKMISCNQAKTDKIIHRRIWTQTGTRTHSQTNNMKYCCDINQISITLPLTIIDIDVTSLNKVLHRIIQTMRNWWLFLVHCSSVGFFSFFFCTFLFYYTSICDIFFDVSTIITGSTHLYSNTLL